MSVVILGIGQLVTASTLEVSIDIVVAEILNTTNELKRTENLHFFNLNKEVVFGELY